MNVNTVFEYPPIPDRNFDWSATFDGYDEGDFIGRGRTEMAAVLDLFDHTLLTAFEREPAPNDSDWEKVQALLKCVKEKT